MSIIGFLTGRGEQNIGALILKALFFLLMITLAAVCVFIDFKGLSDAKGIEQAQISREIARNWSFETKTLRPKVIADLEEREDRVNLAALQDTYFAPLNPLVNGIALKLATALGAEWEFDTKGRNRIYHMDRWIAATSIILFLASIGITYLLISRVFDARIAGVTALLMLLCQLFWDFAQTGLPQMLMLFLFSFALYFLYKAVEIEQIGRPPYLWVALAGGFFGLLVLSHWLAIWLFVGVIIFCAAYFRPRGIMSLVLISVFLLIVSPWLIWNWSTSGSMLGSSFYTFYTGGSGLTEGLLYRNFAWSPESTEGLGIKIMSGVLKQVEKIHILLGSVVVAPIFFLSLMHPFKRAEIATFRWAILLIWIFAAFGMGLFGLNEEKMDSNQLYLLFIPIMTAYGLAFLTIIWNRLGLPMQHFIVRYGHLLIVIVISAMPLLLTLYPTIKFGLQMKSVGGGINYPPYFPPTIAKLNDWFDEDEIIVSDMPWAVAWYADRLSLWLPKDPEQFESFEKRYQSHFPVGGFFLTPITRNAELVSQIMAKKGEYSSWAPLILNGSSVFFQVNLFKILPGYSFFNVDRFSYSKMIGLAPNNAIIVYSNRERWRENSKTTLDKNR